MDIKIRITKVDEQDTLRRDDMLQMTPTQRIDALVEMRDKLYPYAPLERIISIRVID